MGRVVRRIASLFRTDWVTFGLLAILLVVFPRVAWSWGLRLSGHSVPPGLAAYGSLWFWAGNLVNLISNAGVQATLVYAAMGTLRGRRTSPREALVNGLRFFPSVIVILLGCGVAAGLGMILFVVPGVIIALALMVAVPVEVAERTGIAASFGRSADLTNRHRGVLFGLAVLYCVVAGILLASVQMGLNLVYSVHASWAPWLGPAVASIGVGVQETLVGAAAASIYYELRLLKEGVGPDQLSTVFD